MGTLNTLPVLRLSTLIIFLTDAHPLNKSAKHIPFKV